MSARDELADEIERAGQIGPCTVGGLKRSEAEYYADALIAAGYANDHCCCGTCGL